MSTDFDRWHSPAWVMQSRDKALYDLYKRDTGAVTQLVGITTGVTLNDRAGVITTVSNPSIGAGAEATFTVTNSLADATDVILVSVATQFTDGLVIAAVTTVAAGSFNITLTNVSAAAVSAGAAVINYVIVT